jgi:hypothetical protein
MIWLTWRQFRTQAWAGLAALTALAIAYAVTGPHLAHLYDISGIPGCRTNCGSLIDSFIYQASGRPTGTLYSIGIGAMLGAPALIGVFWGAPLVARELEAGTHRLVWNQSVTRTRWLTVKLAGVGVASMACAGLFSLAVSWWASPIDKAKMNRMLPEVFAARGIVPIGVAAFAFVLGVTAGVLIRRTVPAMAVTLVVVVAAQVAMPMFVRPHLMAPVHATGPLNTSSIAELQLADGNRMSVVGTVNQPGAWVLSNRSITTSGHLFTGPANTQVCNRTTSPEKCIEWVDTLHLRQQVSYQPASRFWTFQWYETTIFLVLSALLAAFCFWWVRRRLT